MLKNNSFRFLPAEKFTFLYILITSIIIIVFKHDFNAVSDLLLHRAYIILGICFLAMINSYKRIWVLKFLRYIFLGVLLSYWYPETFEINKTFPNLDYLLANWEQYLFGFQPALVFAKAFPQHWFSEIMNAAYLAYYPIIVITGLYFYFKDSKYFKLFFFSVIFSFYLYYLIFVLFPTAGPQYYYIVNGLENVKGGIFHQIGTYFQYHHVLVNDSNGTGFFLKLVDTTQLAGERPTAAFPSSHVGISTLIMLHIYKKKFFHVFMTLFPIYLALVAATVYIQAHYLIDVIAGLLTAVLFFFVSARVYNKLFLVKQ
jgi:membrane-associated phospholipid phosphatase